MNKKVDTINLINSLNSKYGIAIVKLAELSLGADMEACTYKAETSEGKSYFVKVKLGHSCDLSATLLALLQSPEIPQIIPPIKTVDGKFIHYMNDYTVSIYPFINGQNGFCSHLNPDQWIVLGKALKKIHQFPVPSLLKDQIKKETYSSKGREYVRSLHTHIQDLNGDDTALNLKTFMKEHWEIIDRLVDRAEFLSKKIEEQSPQIVLCHSDIHAGNVLIDENGALYIVDWDNPIMAPKERDLMFVGGGVANVWNQPEEEDFFYQGYGKPDLNELILTYYRHERIVEDIAEYGQALLLKIAGEENRTEMYRNFMAMFEPNGVVDIAFKTDKKLTSMMKENGYPR